MTSDDLIDLGEFQAAVLDDAMNRILAGIDASLLSDPVYSSAFRVGFRYGVITVLGARNQDVIDPAQLAARVLRTMAQPQRTNGYE